MSLSTQPYKGARDFYPDDKRLQKWMFGVWRKTVESFGYQEYDAPVLEPTELYASKTSDEIVNEQTYSFTDRGGRDITMRTEMTPSVSRMVAAKRQELAYPLRLYSIPNLYRYERPQRGRLREFWQLNVDLFGIDNVSADFEMIQISHAIMKNFGAKQSAYQIKINSRELVNFLMMDYFKLDDVQTESLIRLIDKKDKLESAEFRAKLDALLSPSQKESNLVEKILNLLSISEISKLPTELLMHRSVIKLMNILDMVTKVSITNISFDISLMRGFDYYTDIVFEVFDTHPDNNRSMFGGGRYDGLVGQFGVDPVPTVGFGMGDVPLHNFLVLHELMPNLSHKTDVYVILIGDVFEEAIKPIDNLREIGINVAVDSSDRRLDKKLKSADKHSARYVVFIGEQELKEQQFRVKNMKDGSESVHSIDRIGTMIQDYRQSQ